MPFTINGFGTKFYGADPYPDGTHMTTEWVTAFYFPLVPLRSLRVISNGGNSYRVIEELPVNSSQAQRVFFFALTYSLWTLLWSIKFISSNFSDVPGGWVFLRGLAFLMVAFIMAIPLILVWAIRRRKRNAFPKVSLTKETMTWNEKINNLILGGSEE